MLKMHKHFLWKYPDTFCFKLISIASLSMFTKLDQSVNGM